MIPIWAWNQETKRYEVFPTHLLDTYEDGKQGMTFEYNNNNNSEKTKAFLKFRGYFEPDPREAEPTKPLLRFRYYLKEKP